MWCAGFEILGPMLAKYRYMRARYLWWGPRWWLEQCRGICRCLEEFVLTWFRARGAEKMTSRWRGDWDLLKVQIGVCTYRHKTPTEGRFFGIASTLLMEREGEKFPNDSTPHPLSIRIPPNKSMASFVSTLVIYVHSRRPNKWEWNPIIYLPNWIK